MRFLIDEYGDILLGIGVAVFIFVTVGLTLPLIRDSLPSFFDSVMGG